MSASSLPKNTETRLFINGKFTESSDGKKFKVISPTTGEFVAEVFEATVEDVNTAVAAAQAAFPAWSDLEPPERGAYLAKLGKLLTESTQELAVLEALSMGKPVSQYWDSFFAASTFAHYAEAGYEAKGTTSLNSRNFVNLTFRQPVGVAAAIIPWNAPLIFASQKIAAALAAGCTIVLKSSEKAPLTCLKLAQLVEQVGIPPGVVNIISGYGTPAGNTLASHMDVRVLSFVGSLATGKKIQGAAASSNLKTVILELGGKSPALIFEDADLEQAAAQTQYSIQMMSGQACMANSRIYVQDTVAGKFKESFKKIFGSSKLGDPLDPETTQGPQADKIQFERVLEYLKLGKEGNGTLELGGNAKMQGGNGFYIEPTVFVNVPEDSRTMKEEIFGPVVQINTFKTEREAIEKANDTQYGLYASVFTNDVNRAMRVAKKLEAGTVGVNCTSPTTAMDMPFGGYKMSGTGREGYGYSLDHYLETKAVCIKLKPAEGEESKGGLSIFGS